ncbi:MAG: bifunctional 2',3'-cyclic-nucleotide 2'-phosphodiesterase/3'-nucleotidase [Jhaorihella sp.]
MSYPDRPAAGTSTDPAQAAPDGLARLRLLATTDLHMQLAGHDYYADRPDPTGGLTRVASLIAAARAEARGMGATVLLLDNGDAMQGTPMGDVITTRSPHADVLMRAFGYLRYDALGLGNHDFSFGLEALEAVLAGAPCPVLSSNLDRTTPETLRRVAPFAVLDRTVRAGHRDHALRIGVLSLLPPQTVEWDAHLLKGRLAVSDILDTARRHVPVLRRLGCQLIVALAHSGIGASEAAHGMENAVIPLAAVDGIDAIVAGHTHLLLPGPMRDAPAHVDPDTGTVHGKPVVMAGSAGTHLGVIDLDLAADTDGRWRVAGARCALRPVARRRPDGRPESLAAHDPRLSRLVAPAHAATRAEMARPVGRTERPLHSYFSLFAPDRALALVAAAQAAALRPHLAGTDAEALPLLSAAAPGRFGGRAGPQNYTDVPAGPVSRRHLADLCVFDNQLRALIVTGAMLRDWLEVSAGQFHTIAPGSRGAALVDAAMPGHDFDVLHGVEYRIDLSVPARFGPEGSRRAGSGSRIRELRHDGRPVTPDQRFVVALNSYRANGGGRALPLARATPVAVPPLSIRDAVAQWLAGHAAPDPLTATAAPWAFAPMPGTHVKALTGPGALAHVDELAGFGCEPDGIDENGFLRLSLSF